MAPSKTEYPKLIELLNEAKKEYLKEKTEVLNKMDKDRRGSIEPKITDEDLIPLELLRQTLEKLKNKFNEGCRFVNKYIQECQSAMDKKIRKLQVENVKIKRIIENNVFIALINEIMDDRREKVWSLGYKIRLLHLVLTKTLFKTTKEVNKRYFDVIQLSKDNNSEFRNRLQKELELFNNKPVTIEVDDNISDLDSEKLAMVFQRLDAFREGISSARNKEEEKGMIQDLDREIANVEDVKDKDSFIDESFEKNEDLFGDKSIDSSALPGGIKPFTLESLKPPEPPKFTHLDEEDKEDREVIEERKRKEAEEREWMAKYRDTESGEPFNPIKKFGFIEDDYLVYDNATSSYPLNLPTDYYQRYVKSTVPSKKDGKWFIRPHHIEKLTTHVKSIKDDVLNTNYYSHYHDESKNKVKIDEVSSAIHGLENKISEIKDYVKMMKMNNGTWDPDEEQLLVEDPEINREARNRFERLMKEGKTGKKNLYTVKAFEALLFEQRRIEKEMLNVQREREYEKNRPPQDGWYKLKNSEFSKELYRNRMALKPNNQNRVYLDNLKDPYLY